MKLMRDKRENHSGEVFSDEQFLRYIELREAEKHPMHTKEQRAYYLVWLLWREPAGTAYIVLLDKRNRFLKTHKIKDNRLWQGQLFAALEEARQQLGAVTYFVGHNHVDNPLLPSLEDREITKAMMNWKEMEFGGHFIIDGSLGYVEIE